MFSITAAQSPEGASREQRAVNNSQRLKALSVHRVKLAHKAHEWVQGDLN